MIYRALDGTPYEPIGHIQAFPEITEAKRDELLLEIPVAKRKGVFANVDGVMQIYDGTAWRVQTNSANKGKVIQTVQATHSTRVDVDTTTPTDTGLTASITPEKTTSKIRVTVFQPMRLFNADATDIRGVIDLLRASTVIQKQTPGVSIGSTSGIRLLSGTAVFSKEDTPTIADPPEPITYKTQAYQGAVTNTVSVNVNRDGTNMESVIILEEIE